MIILVVALQLIIFTYYQIHAIRWFDLTFQKI
jgi:hypothetical protein